MTAKAQDPLTGETAKSTRTLLRVVILSLIAAAAIASRLFSVIRKCRYRPAEGANRPANWLQLLLRLHSES